MRLVFSYPAKLKMTDKTNEELLEIIYGQENVNAALVQLIYNLRPMMIKIGREHLRKVPIYDKDDYIQEGSLVLWKIIDTRKYNGRGKLSSLFYTMFKRRCINLYRNYVLKNRIQLSECEDYYCYGYHICTLVEDEYATEYRRKKKEWDKHYSEKTCRQKPSKKKKPVMTPEERREKNRQYSREYYATHKEQCQARKKRWYQEHREYALLYQKLYDQGVRIGKKGSVPKQH